MQVLFVINTGNGDSFVAKEEGKITGELKYAKLFLTFKSAKETISSLDNSAFVQPVSVKIELME